MKYRVRGDVLGVDQADGDLGISNVLGDDGADLRLLPPDLTLASRFLLSAQADLAPIVTAAAGGAGLAELLPLARSRFQADDPVVACAQSGACGCGREHSGLLPVPDTDGGAQDRPLPGGPPAAGADPQGAPAIDPGVDLAATPAGAAGVRYGDTFKLHSNPGSSLKIFLDLDGHTTTGTLWNSASWGSTFYSPAYSFEGGESFTAAELAAVQQIWARMAEYFSPFNVDVTTEDPGVEALRYSGAGDTAYGIRVVITDEAKPGGGIAYLNSFTWSSDTPAFVYANNLADAPRYIADAAAHEAGHTFGLSHDGQGGNGYYQGHGGGGGPSWAPTLGTGYYADVVQWSRGEYAGANNTEDDLTVITTRNLGVGYRADDHGNTFGTASALGGTVSGSVATVQRFGVISGSGARNDIDMFRLDVGAGGALDLSVSAWTRVFVTGSPDPVFTPAPFSMLDVRLDLYDASFGRVAFSDEIARIDGRIQLSGLSGGTYYLAIDGTGWGNPLAASPTGWTEYGSLGQYMVTGTYTAVSALPPPVLSVAAPAVAALAEGAGGTTAFTFTVTRSGDLSGASSAAWSVAGTGANPASAADFAGGVLPAGTVTFAAGEASRTITVLVAGDTAFEADEGFALTLATPTGATLGTAASATATIVNDDATPRLVLSKAALATSEAGASDALVVSATGVTGEVVVQLGGLDATEGGLSAASVTLNAANGWAATVSVAGRDDRDADGATTYALQFSAAGLETVSAMVTNQDDDIALASIGLAAGGTRKGTTASGATLAALGADDGVAMTITETGPASAFTGGWRWQFTGLQAGDHRLQVDAVSTGERFRLEYSTDGAATWRAFQDGPGNATAWDGAYLASGVGTSLWVRLLDATPKNDSQRDSFAVDLLTLEKVVTPGAADLVLA